MRLFSLLSLLAITGLSLGGSTGGKHLELLNHHKVQNLIKNTGFLNADNFEEYVNLVSELKTLRSDHVLKSQTEKKPIPKPVFPFNINRGRVSKKSIMDMADPDMKDLMFGDYMLSHDQIKHHIAHLKDTPSRGKRQASTTYPTWPGGLIPFYFDPNANFSASDMNTMRTGFQMWQAQTCIVFNEINAASNAVMITNTAGDGCFSNSIGMIGSGNLVNLAGTCVTEYIAAHEIGHVFGFYHHMSRYDRDSYVTVETQNIQPAYVSQYDKETSQDTTNYNLPYDYGSVMHYPDDGFSTGAGPTMVASNPMYQTTMGIQQSGPSYVDLMLLNNDYNCLGTCPSLPCQNQGIPNPANCAVCICPSGFAGAYCDQRPTSTNPNCSATTLMATNTWQSVTLNFNQPYDYGLNVDQCTWWIQSPPGTQVQIQLQSMERYGSCGFTAFELKADQPDWRITGYKICPNTGSYGVVSLSNIGTITAVSNLSIVSLQSSWGVFNVELQYQYVVTGSGGATNPPPSIIPTTTSTTLAASSSCADADPSCASYDPTDCQSTSQYYAYMQQNCAETCGFCSSGLTNPSTSTCADSDPDCAAYDPTDCQSSSQYYAYMQQNCAKTCGMC